MTRFLKFVAQYIIIFEVLVSLAFSPLFLLFSSSHPVFAADSQSISQELEKYGIKLVRFDFGLGDKGVMVNYNDVNHVLSDPQNLGIDINTLPFTDGTYNSMRAVGLSNTGGSPYSVSQLLIRGKQDYDFRQNKIKNEQDVAKRNAIVNELQNAGLRTTGDYFAQAVEARMGGKSVQDILAEQPAINPRNKLPTETFQEWQQRTGVAPPGQQTEVTPTLSVIPSEQSVPAFAGNLIFRIINTSGGIMNWTASVTNGSSWFSIDDVTAGVNNGIMSEKTIMVRFLQNNDPSSRTAEITVIAPDATGSPKVVTITQAGSAIISPVPNTQEQKAAEQERARRLEAERQQQEDQRKIDEQLRAKAAADEALKRAKNDEEQRIAEEARKKAEDARIAAEQEAQKHQQEEALRKAQEEQKQTEEQRKVQTAAEEARRKEQTNDIQMPQSITRTQNTSNASNPDSEQPKTTSQIPIPIQQEKNVSSSPNSSVQLTESNQGVGIGFIDKSVSAGFLTQFGSDIRPLAE